MFPASSEASRSPYTKRCIHKKVHTQNGVHKMRSVAAEAILLFNEAAEVPHRDLYAPTCMCTALGMHRLVFRLHLASLDAGVTPPPP